VSDGGGKLGTREREIRWGKKNRGDPSGTSAQKNPQKKKKTQDMDEDLKKPKRAGRFGQG